MRPVLLRLALLLAVLAPVAAAAPEAIGAGPDAVAADTARAALDSLVALPAMTPRDPQAGIRLTPHALALDPLNRIWVLDRSRGRVLRLDPGREGPSAGEGFSFSPAAQTGDAAGAPYSDLAASGTFLYLLDPAVPAIALLDLDGHLRDRVDLSSEIERAGRRGFLASRLIVGRSGDLWLADLHSGDLLHFDRRGRFLEAPLDALAGPDRPSLIEDLALDEDDTLRLLVADPPRLAGLDPEGRILPARSIGPTLPVPASLATTPAGEIVVLDASGVVRIFPRGGGPPRWEGVPPGGERTSGVHPILVDRQGILYRADPTRGQILRWRIVPPAGGDDAR
ncbi:MAG: hypothetical protein ACE15D_12115 [Candidatus Eisenbacteria bacterium]